MAPYVYLLVGGLWVIVVVASCRELKRFGATVRYVVALKGLRDREEAARLAAVALANSL